MSARHLQAVPVGPFRRRRSFPDTWDPHLRVIQEIPQKVPAYLHTLVQVPLAPTGWDLYLLLRGPQASLDQGSIPEDPPCQVKHPSSRDHHQCKVDPQWNLRVDLQDLTAPISTSHPTHLDSQPWTCYSHNPLVPQVRGCTGFAKRNHRIR